MSKVVCDVAVTADGYVSGRGQTREKPFGDAPEERLFGWMFNTRSASLVTHITYRVLH